MGRGTIALVWLVMLVGIGAAYGMGVADGRKRAEGLAAERERDYQYRIQEVCRMLTDRVADAGRDGIAADAAAANPPDRAPWPAPRSSVPPPAGAAPIQSALVAQSP